MTEIFKKITSYLLPVSGLFFVFTLVVGADIKAGASIFIVSLILYILARLDSDRMKLKPIKIDEDKN